MASNGLTVPNDYRLRYSDGERHCVECKSGLPDESERPWLSKGTPYCQYCARARRDIAFKTLKARQWMVRWTGQMFSAKLIALDGMAENDAKKLSRQMRWLSRENFA